MQIVTTNIKSHVVQAHYLKKDVTSIVLYGDFHSFNEKAIEIQEQYIENNILNKSNIPIITEKPLIKKDILSTIPIFFFLQNKSEIFENITCIENRTFMYNILDIENALREINFFFKYPNSYLECYNVEEFKKKYLIEDKPNLQKTLSNFMSEIETILKDLENEFLDTINTNMLSDEIKDKLTKDFTNAKNNILDFINNWNTIFEKNNLLTKPIIQILLDSVEVNLIKEMTNEIYSETNSILDFKLLIEAIKQIKTNKKIAIFAGGCHIDNLIKILESIGFTIQEEKRNPQESYIWLNPIEVQSFDWIIN